MAPIFTAIRLFTITLLWMGCLSAPLAGAAVFKWRDAKGRIHYGDRPPTNAAPTLQRIPIASHPASDSGADERRARRNRLLESYAHERANKRAERTKRAAANKRNQAACDQVRARLAALEQAGSLFQTTADGKRKYFTDAQRTRLIRDARDTIHAHCE